jgi:hypothetical protein
MIGGDGGALQTLIPSRTRASFRAIWLDSNKHIFKDKSSTTEEMVDVEEQPKGVENSGSS